MNSTIDKNMSPQDFLDIVENTINKRKYITKRYLIEYYKPTVSRIDITTQIKVEDIVATSVKALRWDYLIGDDSIDHREFIIQYDKDEFHFINLFKRSEYLFNIGLSKFKKEVQLMFLREDDLEKSKLEKKLDLNLNISAREIKIIENNTENDEFSNNILKEIYKE